MAWVFEHSRSTLGARLVLLAIANHADRDGDNSFASVATLAEEAHLSERQVQRAIASLLADGELELVGRHGSRADRMTNVYRLPGVQLHGATNRHPAGAHGVTSATPRGDIYDAHGVTPMSPEPSLEPSGNRSSQDASARDSGGGAVENLLPRTSEDQTLVEVPEFLVGIGHDQAYLLDRLNRRYGELDGKLTPLGVKRLNGRYGEPIVTDAMRYLHGFGGEIRTSLYAHLEALCQVGEEEARV